jgi:hypothetical protein
VKSLSFFDAADGVNLRHAAQPELVEGSSCGRLGPCFDKLSMSGVWVHGACPFPLDGFVISAAHWPKPLVDIKISFVDCIPVTRR